MTVERLQSSGCEVAECRNDPVAPPQKEPELTTIVETITRTEGTVKGEEVPHTSNALPIELLERLTL